MCGYNFLADGKSKAGSVFLMCDKKVKESRQILGGDSAASVLHTDGQKVTVETERDFDRSAKADEIAWYQGQSAEWQIP